MLDDDIEIEIDYNFEGLAFGIIPVYLEMKEGQRPKIQVKYSKLDPVLDYIEIAFYYVSKVIQFFNSNYEYGVPIKITKDLREE